MQIKNRLLRKKGVTKSQELLNRNTRMLQPASERHPGLTELSINEMRLHQNVSPGDREGHPGRISKDKGAGFSARARVRAREENICLSESLWTKVQTVKEESPRASSGSDRVVQRAIQCVKQGMLHVVKCQNLSP